MSNLFSVKLNIADIERLNTEVTCCCYHRSSSDFTIIKGKIPAKPLPKKEDEGGDRAEGQEECGGRCVNTMFLYNDYISAIVAYDYLRSITTSTLMSDNKNGGYVISFNMPRDKYHEMVDKVAKQPEKTRKR